MKSSDTQLVLHSTQPQSSSFLVIIVAAAAAAAAAAVVVVVVAVVDGIVDLDVVVAAAEIKHVVYVPVP